MWQIHRISQCARNSRRHETARRASEERLGRERVLEVRTRVLGEEHPNTLSSMWAYSSQTATATSDQTAVLD